jgi:hypothetical protein
VVSYPEKHKPYKKAKCCGTYLDLREMNQIEVIKVKVKLSPCLTKHHAMKTYWGSGDIAPCILDLGTRWR